MLVNSRCVILDGKPAPELINIEVWEPNPDKPGYLRFIRMKTLQEVFNELKKWLKVENLLPEEYFDLRSHQCEMPIPREYWRMVSFAVKGSSEGHYIHIGLILKGGQYQDLFLGKTFQGLDYALKVANACTKAFES